MKIEDYTQTSADNEFDFKKSDSDKLKEDHFLVNEEISAFLVYLVLKEIFGAPNFKPLESDSIQWIFEIVHNNLCFRISDWQGTSWMISCFTKTKRKSNEAKNAAELLEKIIIAAASRLKNIENEHLKEKKERFIENPFKTYYDAAIVLLNEARAVDTNSAKTAEERNKLLSLVSTLCTAAFTSFLSSFEGCLNLLYEIYLNKSLREERIYDRLGREQIDIKFRLAPFYCEGFSVKTLNSSDQRFKDFLKLINLRNDFVHAKITESMQQTIVRDDDFSFILNKKHTGELPNNINQLNINHIEITNKFIDNAVMLVTESMETRTEREFRKIIFERHIQVEEVNGIIIPVL